MNEKCKTCGQPLILARKDFGDGTCNFCHEKYDNKNDNYGKPKWEYIHHIQKLSDKDLSEETEHKIWLSAYANNNPRSDYHFQCDACFDECERREKPEIYRRAWKLAAS